MQSKLITSRFAATCRKCRKPIEIGSRAYWRKGYGSWHIACQDDIPAAQSAPAKMDSSVTFEFSELREAFHRIADGKTAGLNALPSNDELHKSHGEAWKGSRSNWVGATADEMRGWLAKGYSVSSIADMSPDLITPRYRRKMKFDEDGELQLDLVYSGFDYPYLEWEKRQRKPGMRVNIDMVFNAETSAEIISQYQTWIARALFTLETEGYDCEVNIRIATSGSWQGTHSRHETLIRVKRENEASDFANWSAIFSPGGFRMLGFTAITLAGGKLGRRVNSGLGAAMADREWSVSFDGESRTLSVRCAKTPSDFPDARMTEMLKAAISSSHKAG